MASTSDAEKAVLARAALAALIPESCLDNAASALNDLNGIERIRASDDLIKLAEALLPESFVTKNISTTTTAAANPYAKFYNSLSTTPSLRGGGGTRGSEIYHASVLASFAYYLNPLCLSAKLICGITAYDTNHCIFGMELLEALISQGKNDDGDLEIAAYAETARGSIDDPNSRISNFESQKGKLWKIDATTGKYSTPRSNSAKKYAIDLQTSQNSPCFLLGTIGGELSSMSITTAQLSFMTINTALALHPLTAEFSRIGTWNLLAVAENKWCENSSKAAVVAFVAEREGWSACALQECSSAAPENDEDYVKHGGFLTQWEFRRGRDVGVGNTAGKSESEAAVFAWRRDIWDQIHSPDNTAPLFYTNTNINTNTDTAITSTATTSTSSDVLSSSFKRKPALIFLRSKIGLSSTTTTPQRVLALISVHLKSFDKTLDKTKLEARLLGTEIVDWVLQESAALNIDADSLVTLICGDFNLAPPRCERDPSTAPGDSWSELTNRHFSPALIDNTPTNIFEFSADATATLSAKSYDNGFLNVGSKTLISPYPKGHVIQTTSTSFAEELNASKLHRITLPLPALLDQMNIACTTLETKQQPSFEPGVLSSFTRAIKNDARKLFIKRISDHKPLTITLFHAAAVAGAGSTQVDNGMVVRKIETELNSVAAAGGGTQLP